MSLNVFTVADQAFLAKHGIADVEEPRPRSEWTYARVLEVAADGSLTSPETGSDDLPVRLDGRPATEFETRAVVDLLGEGELLLDGTRITLTGSGHELLARWTGYRRVWGEQG